MVLDNCELEVCSSLTQENRRTNREDALGDRS